MSEKTLRVYVKKEYVFFDKELKTYVANGYRVFGAETVYPYIELGDIPIFEVLWPDLEEVKENLVFEATFETEKELKLGWFDFDKGKTRGILEKIKDKYHMVVENPELKKLRAAVDDIRYGHAKPRPAHAF
jgi:hypothetical protein